MQTTIINTTSTTTATNQLNNTVLSAYHLQSKLNSQLEKITYEYESMVSDKDLMEDALNQISKKGLVPVSLDKYEVELTPAKKCIKVRFEFTVRKGV
jgi:hypothetical protein